MHQIEDLETFVRIVDAGSITRAAAQMNTVKSAISQRLSRLETRLGVKLLQRTTRAQSLTDAGDKFYQSAVDIIAAIQQAEAAVKNQNQALSGRIKLALPLSFGLMHMSTPLIAFNQQHPDIIMDVDFNDRQVDIMHEGFDLAIRVAQLSDSNLIAKKITQTDMVLCASQTYIEAHGLPAHPSELKQGHVKLKYAQAKDSWQFVNQTGQSIQVNIPTVMTASNGEFLCAAAIEGQGMVMLPDFICYQAIKNGRLIRLLPGWACQGQLNVYAIYPPNRHLPQRVRVLVDFLSVYFADHQLFTATDSQHGLSRN